MVPTFPFGKIILLYYFYAFWKINSSHIQHEHTILKQLPAPTCYKSVALAFGYH